MYCNELSALGIPGVSEQALCHALGVPDLGNYLGMSMTIAGRIEKHLAERGYNPQEQYAGLIMDLVADIMRQGGELGRALERAPILDALYVPLPPQSDPIADVPA